MQVVDKCDQTRLRVYFLTDPRDLRPPFEGIGDPQVIPEPLPPTDFRIYNPRGMAPDVEVVLCPGPDGMRWDDDVEAGRRYLEICVAEPGDFTEYRLRIDDGRIDRFFHDVQFSFKVGCEDRLDCAEPVKECPPEDLVDFPVDYLARDFVSFRNALLDFAAQRYPDWQLPIEADVGVMLLEVMAALGDELSYLQDRHNREAYLETATERRSLRKKARLLDYEIHDGRMASTLLELTVQPAVESVEGGSPVWARVEGSTPIRFELGEGMRDRGENFPVDALWNPGNFTVYLFDDGQECLEAGATELFVRNDPANPNNSGGVLFDQNAANLWSAGCCCCFATARSILPRSIACTWFGSSMSNSNTMCCSTSTWRASVGRRRMRRPSRSPTTSSSSRATSFRRRRASREQRASAWGRSRPPTERTRFRRSSGRGRCSRTAIRACCSDGVSASSWKRRARRDRRFTY